MRELHDAPFRCTVAISRQSVVLKGIIYSILMETCSPKNDALLLHTLLHPPLSHILKLYDSPLTVEQSLTRKLSKSVLKYQKRLLEFSKPWKPYRIIPLWTFQYPSENYVDFSFFLSKPLSKLYAIPWHQAIVSQTLKQITTCTNFSSTITVSPCLHSPTVQSTIDCNYSHHLLHRVTHWYGTNPIFSTRFILLCFALAQTGKSKWERTRFI